MLETLFYGKPVIAFRVGGIPEFVRDGENGFLHPFGDVHAMGASLDALVESPSLAAALGRCGQKQVEQRFSADEIVPKYEATYRRVLRSPPC
jgi:glycosyltransferase involved in cell wall biosynthesis